MTIHSVKKVPGIDHSKNLLKEVITNLFDAKLAHSARCCQFISTVFRDFSNG